MLDLNWEQAAQRLATGMPGAQDRQPPSGQKHQQHQHQMTEVTRPGGGRHRHATLRHPFAAGIEQDQAGQGCKQKHHSPAVGTEHAASLTGLPKSTGLPGRLALAPPE